MGLLIGALFGGWNRVNPIEDDIPVKESTARALPTPAPGTKTRPASRSARPATLPAASRPDVATPARTSTPSAVSPPGIAPPPAALSDASTIVEAIPSAPAPSIEVSAPPLAAAPLPVASSMPPAAPPAVAAAGGLAAAMVAADEVAIKTTLRRYEEAYEHLDATAAAAVWPTVDRRALSHAFAGLASQRLNFRGCEVVVQAFASMATASCNGTAEYVRKVGDARVRVEPRQWTFTLNKAQGAWRIEAVDGSR